MNSIARAFTIAGLAGSLLLGTSASATAAPHADSRPECTFVMDLLLTTRAMVEAGLHPKTGGSGLQACSGDMLLEALVACAGVTLKAVSTALGIPLKSGAVSAALTSRSSASSPAVRRSRYTGWPKNCGSGVSSGIATTLL